MVWLFCSQCLIFFWCTPCVTPQPLYMIQRDSLYTYYDVQYHEASIMHWFCTVSDSHIGPTWNSLFLAWWVGPLGGSLSPLVNYQTWDIKIVLKRYFDMPHKKFGAYWLRNKREIGNTCLWNEKNLDFSTTTIGRVKDTLSATSKSALATIKWCSSILVD